MRKCIVIAQSVTCLATDACLTAIPGVASSIPARSHTFDEIDHEIISTVILLPSADSFKKGCCQLQAKVCARITGYPLVQACPGKSVVRWTDRPTMTIAVDLGRKATQQNKIVVTSFLITMSEASVLNVSVFNDSWNGATFINLFTLYKSSIEHNLELLVILFYP